MLLRPSGSTTPPPPPGTGFTVRNVDSVPYPDRLVTSRIQTPADSLEVVRDKATARITNTGGSPLTVKTLTVTGAWQVNPAVSLPATVAAGGHLDVTVKFTATGGDLNTGSLAVGTDAGSQTVQLAGFWQVQSEHNQEPDLHEITQVLGYSIAIPDNLSDAGRVHALGDEVLSKYWKATDSSKPITVRQVASYHTYPNPASLAWYLQNTTSNHTLVSVDPHSVQTMLPGSAADPTKPTAGSFSPGGAFGWKVGSEYSDDTKNDQTKDQSHGCSGACGHHMRFFPVKDRNGTVIPHEYLFGMDYSAINYDYQDNVYLVTNMDPA